MKITMVGPFGLSPKHTVSGRALPLGQALVRRGHQVRLLVPPWDQPGDSGRRFHVDGVDIIHVRVPTPALGWLGHAAITLRLLFGVLAERAEAVHVFKPKGHAGLVGLTLWRLSRLGVVRSRIVVDADDLEGPGGWNDRARYPAAARRLFAWQERRGWVDCHAVTAASRALAEMALAHGAREVYYLPNGVPGLPELPARDSARAALSVPDGPLALIYTRFVEIGPERLARLLADLCERAPNLHVYVVGAGLGDEQERLAELLGDRGLEGRVLLCGWIERERLPAYWAAADLALYPGDDTPLNRAKSPLRLVELMSAGRAIVAHDVGEAGAYLSGGAGCLVPSGDDEEFVRAAVRLSRDRELQVRLGAAARERIAAEYTWDRLAVRAERAYSRE